MTAVWHRVYAVLGRMSMYRLALLSLAILVTAAVVLSLFGLVGPGPLELVVSAVVLSVACGAVDAAAQRIARRHWRVESSLITAGILLFVLAPTAEPLGLVGLAIAAAVASASKYLIAWRGRHIFNPAAMGAAVLTLITALTAAYDLGSSAWWVGTPALAPLVIVLGVALLVRTEKLRMATLFLVVAVSVGVVRSIVQLQAADLPVEVGAVLMQQLWSSPFLFLGAFMLTEPLTLPPRRWQQLTVAALVGVLVGWPIDVAGVISLGQERALLIGNLVAFLFSVRTAVRLTLAGRETPTPTVRELTFRTQRPLSFLPGQYLELDVPHSRPDARGSRREFSIVSAPEDAPELRIAFRDGKGPQSSFKKALAQVTSGGVVAATGVWGDFVLPRNPHTPILMLAAGIGVTPFVSQLRHVRLAGEERDIVLVYVASDAGELAFRDELEASGIPVIVFTRDNPRDLPAHWTWARGVRLDAEGLRRVVPDLSVRHAFVSGPAGLIADLAPALDRAASITTDAFSGY